MKVGYARVSTTGQSLESQLETLKAFGCEEIFQEKQSGKQADSREQLNALIKFVRAGDILVCTKLDRLARSVNDLGNIAKTLESKGVDLIVTDQSGIDTSNPLGKLLFNILGSIAEFERDLILERTNEGRIKAKNAGVQFGRKPKLDDNKLRSAINDYKQGLSSASEIAKKYGISRASLYRLMNASTTVNS